MCKIVDADAKGLCYLDVGHSGCEEVTFWRLRAGRRKPDMIFVEDARGKTHGDIFEPEGDWLASGRYCHKNKEASFSGKHRCSRAFTPHDLADCLPEECKVIYVW
jgi:hypothetical protein